MVRPPPTPFGRGLRWRFQPPKAAGRGIRWSVEDPNPESAPQPNPESGTGARWGPGPGARGLRDGGPGNLPQTPRDRGARLPAYLRNRPVTWRVFLFVCVTLLPFENGWNRMQVGGEAVRND